VTFGFRKPVILLPAAFPHLDAAIQEAVLTHECLHVRRRDWLFTVIEESIRAAFWFHPAIWWLLGEVQLAREQAVDRATVELTQGREEYVDALLAIAGAQPALDLAPAPLFLRKRHLKQRVVSILKEVRMSKAHSLSALAAGVCILALACWLVAGVFPLAAAPQLVMDEPGVSVDLGGAALIHRPPVPYPAAARASRVEGTVVVEATLDSAGNPVDARVLSGPQELRKAVLQSVLQWHFMRGSGTTQEVSIAFRLPAESGQPEPTAGTLYTKLNVTAPGPSSDAAQRVLQNARALALDSLQVQMANPGLTQDQKDALTARIKETEAAILASRSVGAPTAGQTSAPNAEMDALQEQMKALAAQMTTGNYSQDQLAVERLKGQLGDMAARVQSLRKITAFRTFGLSESASQELLNSLPVHVGDAATTENTTKVTAAVKQFDEHLNVVFAMTSSSAEVEVRISAPGSDTFPGIAVGGKVQEVSPAPGSGTAQRIVVGGQVQEANLVKKVMPVYPPLAREVRLQGAVVLSVIIGQDGSMQEIKVVSGHPMLAPAAMEAVRQWQYKPTLLNGQPVEVSTEVTINFTLQ
jgi:TonB family protein